jgi:putative peptidoglycan lipid II flippase
VSLGILVFHNQITSLLYGRGAFSAGSVEQTGQILQWLGLGIVLMCSIPVLNSSLYAQRRFSWVLYNMVLATIVNIVLAWWLSGYWGLVGIAVAVVVSAAVSVANLWILIRFGQKKHIANHAREAP